jgi:hypothetical protein
MDLVERLMDDLDLTRHQAEGASGTLLLLAQRQLPDEAFGHVAQAIPAVSDIILKAPRCGVAHTNPLLTTLSRWFGGLGSLQAVGEGFARVGVDQTQIRSVAEAVVHFCEDAEHPDAAIALQTAFR